MGIFKETTLIYYYCQYGSRLFGVRIKDGEFLKDECTGNNCLTDLTLQMAIIFVGKQFFSQFNEIFVPYVSSFPRGTLNHWG